MEVFWSLCLAIKDQTFSVVLFLDLGESCFVGLFLVIL